MKFMSPLVVSSFIAVLVVTVVTILIQANAAYAISRDRCLAFPQNYPYMVTRFHQNNCQFRENEGWVTFNPTA